MAFRGILLVVIAILSSQPTLQIHLTRVSLLRVARSMDREIHSRVKRQAITDPQPFPVMNAVLNIPIPTNIGHFPGAASALGDKCDRDEIKMEDGTCQNLLTAGNCGPNEEILLDPDTNMGFCAPRLCPPDRVFVHATQLCHDPQEMGMCPPGRELYYSAYGSSVCSCPDGTIEGDDDLDDDVCDLILGENLQCLAGQVFWFKDFNSPPECLPDPCKGANLNKKPADLPFVPSNEKGECFQLGQSEGVCPSGSFYTLALEELKGQCETLEEAGYIVFSPEELEALKKIYGPTISENTGPPLPSNKNATVRSSSSSMLTSGVAVPLSTVDSGPINNIIDLNPTSGANAGQIQPTLDASSNNILQSAINSPVSKMNVGNIAETQIGTTPSQNPGLIANQNNMQSNIQNSKLSPNDETVVNKNSILIAAESQSLANNAQGLSGQDVAANKLTTKPISAIAASAAGSGSNKPFENLDQTLIHQHKNNQATALGESFAKPNAPSNIVNENPSNQIASIDLNKPNTAVDDFHLNNFESINAQKTVQTNQSPAIHSSQNIQVSQDNNFSQMQVVNHLKTQQTQINNLANQQAANSNLQQKDEVIIGSNQLIPNRGFTDQSTPTQNNNRNVFNTGSNNSQQQLVGNPPTSGQQIPTAAGINGNYVNTNQQNIENGLHQLPGGHQPHIISQNNKVVGGQQRPTTVANSQLAVNTNQQLTPSTSNINSPVANIGQTNNQQLNSFEVIGSQGAVSNQNSIGSLGQNNNQQSIEVIGGQGPVNNHNSLGNQGQNNNQQHNSLEILGGMGQLNSSEIIGQTSTQNYQQSFELFGQGMPNFGFRFRRSLGYRFPSLSPEEIDVYIIPPGDITSHSQPPSRQAKNEFNLSSANEIRYSENKESFRTLSRRKRAIYSHATPSNVFESRLLGCRPGAARDINAKCKKKILPAKIPKHRGTRAAPPVPPTPSCPSGQAFNLRRMCVSVSTAQQSLMAKNLG